MNNSAMWALIVSFFLPLVISVAQRPTLPNWLRVVVMITFVVIASVITSALNGDLDNKDFVTTLLIMAVGAITFYRGVWKASGVAGKIENATSPGA